MLSIAIKNSVILALVILIAHFLLKNSSEDSQGTLATLKSNGSMGQRAETNAAETDLLPSGGDGRDRDRGDVQGHDGNGDDLYSYVYGAGAGAGAGISSVITPHHPHPTTVPPPQAHAKAHPLDEGCGLLMAYEAGSTDQWSMI